MEREINVKGRFAITEVFLWFLIIGLMVGAVFGGVQIIQNSKISNQMGDLRGLSSAVYTYYDKYQKLPGDRNSDGEFDSDNSVWEDLETRKLIQKRLSSPYGSVYSFGFANKSMRNITFRQGNYVSVNLPSDVARIIDIEFDDGQDFSGIVTENTDSREREMTTLYYFLD